MTEPVVSKLAEPVHLTVTKNTKGYSWEVSIHGPSVGETLYMVEEAEKQLKAKYGVEEGSKD